MDIIDPRNANVETAQAIFNEFRPGKEGDVVDVRLLDKHIYVPAGPNLSGANGEIAAWSITTERYSRYFGTTRRRTHTLFIDTFADTDIVTQRFDLAGEYTTEQLPIVLDLVAHGNIPSTIGIANE